MTCLCILFLSPRTSPPPDQAATLPRLADITPSVQSDSKSATGVTKFVARLGAVVVSAVRHIFLPDIPFRYSPLDMAERVVVPIVVLRNHHEYDILDRESAGDRFLDVDALRHELQKVMMPGQTLTVLAGSHSLHDHPTIATALERATRTDSMHRASASGRYMVSTSSVLDTQALLHYMHGTADELAGGLLESADLQPLDPLLQLDLAAPMGDHGDHGAAALDSATGMGTAANQRSAPRYARGRRPGASRTGLSGVHGTRVLPVYVFSLSGASDEDTGHLTTEDHDMVAPYQDAVVVLQSNDDSIAVPYVSEDEQVSISGRRTTRHVLAGVASALGALGDPARRFSEPHGRCVNDLLWSTGHHPFGPFSNCSSLSQVSRDTAVRNVILSRVDAATRLVQDALGDVRAFADEHLANPLESVHGKTVTALHPNRAGLSRQDAGAAGMEGKRWIDELYHEHREGAELFARDTVARLHDSIESITATFECTC